MSDEDLFLGHPVKFVDWPHQVITGDVVKFQAVFGRPQLKIWINCKTCGQRVELPLPPEVLGPDAPDLIFICAQGHTLQIAAPTKEQVLTKLADRKASGYVSYRGLMSDGASMPCKECAENGRGDDVQMVYRGVIQVSQIEGVRAEDTLDTLPSDVWECPWGHRYFDGY